MYEHFYNATFTDYNANFKTENTLYIACTLVKSGKNSKMYKKVRYCPVGNKYLKEPKV